MQGDNKKKKKKPQYVIDAERRYNHMRNVVEFMDNNFKRYSEIVKYAKDNWSNMIITSERHQVSIADQIATMTDCPYFIAEDVARMINIQNK